MIGYEVTWTEPMTAQTRTTYYCEACKVPMGSLTSDPIHIRGPITLPADAVCAACGRSSPTPASWTRIIESVLARVLAGEPAAQVVADYPDEHSHTIEGLEKVEEAVRLLRDLLYWIEVCHRLRIPLDPEGPVGAQLRVFLASKEVPTDG